jgi:hypothetical protein
MEQRPSWKADIHTADEETSTFYETQTLITFIWNPFFLFYVLEEPQISSKSTD